MTQDELDALPETGGLSYEVVGTNERGLPMIRPVIGGSFCLFQDEDTILLVCDSRGDWWTTGWHSGTLYKRRTSPPW